MFWHTNGRAQKSRTLPAQLSQFDEGSHSTISKIGWNFNHMLQSIGWKTPKNNTSHDIMDSITLPYEGTLWNFVMSTFWGFISLELLHQVTWIYFNLYSFLQDYNYCSDTLNSQMHMLWDFYRTTILKSALLGFKDLSDDSKTWLPISLNLSQNR